MFTCRAHTTADLPIPAQCCRGHSWPGHCRSSSSLPRLESRTRPRGQHCPGSIHGTAVSQQLEVYTQVRTVDLWSHSTVSRLCRVHIRPPLLRQCYFCWQFQDFHNTSGHPNVPSKTQSQKSTKSHHHRGCQAKRHGRSQASRAGSGQGNGA